ncbi:flagellar motor switch protein [Clostridium sulfidigenes]|uniref:Flagellar motor switch protein n=1 Tax=Clostridium sulfidigenes TaxID=318464 RepID=A0A084JIK7_9CLOT|nr:flagellar motor switch phosphatase FliY [Clostridium sulfidigenes]KEZ88791.1 flagellar motor switch protein [Clostridium sulfidigenes]HAR84213.1 flagellar motor switch phosphatase FliY [Clostridium sp.]
MDNSFLSQEEIDALLNGDGGSSENEPVNEPAEELSDLEKDLLGEVGNISMGTAATALSAVVGKPVNITTPTITLSTLNKLKKSFKTPNIVLDVQFVSGIVGGNLFIINIEDSAVIANLMMGGDGVVEPPSELSELEISAVQEAMNQMIGSAATSMATMFSREVNISPPISSVCDENSEEISTDISADEEIVNVSFRMTIGDLVDSNIVQILPIATAKKIVSIMMGTEENAPALESSKAQNEVKVVAEPKEISMNNEDVASETISKDTYRNENNYSVQGQGIVGNYEEPVNVKQASFGQLEEIRGAEMPKNIDLILDVPLELSVELGRTKKNIRDILALTRGSLIELNKLAEEPVDIFINGKRIAHGEVVVVDENFGVKITEIASGEDRVKSLSK